MNKNLIDNFIFKTETNNESVQSINLNMVTETDNDLKKNQVNNKINRFHIVKPNIHVKYIDQSMGNNNLNEDSTSQTNSDDTISEKQENSNQSDNFYNYIDSTQFGYDNISDKLGNQEESEEETEEELNESIKSDTLDELDNIEDLEDLLEKKYVIQNLLKNKYHDEVKKIKKIKKSHNTLDDILLDNNYEKIINLLEQGQTIYHSSNNLIIKLCGNKNCKICLNSNNKLKGKITNKECNKTLLFKSVNNTNRGIKTLYYLLLKLLIVQPNLRNLCKCCEDFASKEYLNSLDKNFIDKKSNIIEDIKTRLEPKKILELQINYLINKFMNIIGLLPCECNFKNKLYNFYPDNYLNFKETIKIYTKTIPQVIKILKMYYNIKDNHEELSLINESRCIHEDIRFNNLTYCKKKKYSNTNQKIILEIIMKIDIINTWVLESIKICIHLYNQQSLEYFRYILYNNQNKELDPSNQSEFDRFKNEKQKNLSEYFNKIYSINNELLDLNYECAKKNIITSIIDFYNKNDENNLINLVLIIKNQIEIRNIRSSDRYDLNDIFIYYVIESFKNNLINLGLEFLKHIKNLKLKKELEPKINYIFNTLLSNEDISIKTKVSYLKIINKNKINVIQFDIINKLIDIKNGDTMILEFNKNENSLFNIDDYKNNDYIFNIIKRCVTNNKVNILDYVLSNLDTSIKSYKIQPIIIYLIEIPKNNGSNYIDNEYEYIRLLDIILKYEKNLDIYINDEKNDQNIGLLEYCINNNLNMSARLLINKNIKLDSILLIKCIENQNHIIFEYIINSNYKLIKIIYMNFTIINFMLYNLTNKNVHQDILMRFLIKILNPIIKYKSDNLISILNYQDEINELFGFKLLNSKLDDKNKIIIFSLVKDLLDPLKINTYKNHAINTYNFPLIVYSMLLNQVEITYMLLNNLFKNRVIKKISSNTNSTIFNYYHSNEDININFVPIILKFIQDKLLNNFDENKYINSKIILESDSNSIELILLLTGFIIYFYIKMNKIKSNNLSIPKNKFISKSYDENGNGYVEITVDSHVNNLLDTESVVNKELNVEKQELLVEKVNKYGNFNKNIWISSNNLTNSTNDNSSSISESNIYFN